MDKQEIYVDEGTKQLLQEFEDTIRESVNIVFTSLPLNAIVDEIEIVKNKQGEIRNIIDTLNPSINKLHNIQLDTFHNSLKSHYEKLMAAIEQLNNDVKKITVQQDLVNRDIGIIKDQNNLICNTIKAQLKEILTLHGDVNYLVAESKNIREWDRLPWYNKLFKSRKGSND